MRFCARIIFLLAAFSLCQLAQAAQDSVQQLQGQQFQSELIRQGYENQQQNEQAPRPAGEWLETWGAIASGTNGSGYGVAKDALSEREAKEKAVYQCVKGGGEGCESNFTYRNQCVAIAQPVEKGGTFDAKASAISIEEASKDAINLCERTNSGMACAVIFSDCTEQLFHRY